MQRWEDIEQFLLDEAARDLADGVPARPCIAAFRGAKPLMLAFLRPHAKGAYLDPMIEVLTIAAGLGADRLMASFSGRAWSWDDPIPPVLPGVGDLRQPVVTVHRVDGSGPDLSTRDLIIPYSVEDGRVVWGERLDQESAEGVIPQLLRVMVERGAELMATDDDIAVQVLRCDRLGHLVGLGPGLGERLGLTAFATGG